MREVEHYINDCSIDASLSLFLLLGVQVGFQPTEYNVAETDGVVNLFVRKFTPSELPVTVLFNTMDGTAVGMYITSLCECGCCYMCTLT